MNITNFAKKLAEKPVFKTRIKSDQVKLPEIAIGYFLAPFCAMFANAIFGAYLNRYYVDVLGWTKFGAFATLLPIVSVIFVVLGNLEILKLCEGGPHRKIGPGIRCCKKLF